MPASPQDSETILRRPAQSGAFAPAPEDRGATAAPAEQGAVLDFAQVYDMYADFVWCSLRRLGVSDASADDALQDVFLVLHRRFGDYDRTRPIKTWLYGITMRVARDHRRRVQRKGGLEPLGDGVADGALGPLDHAMNAEGLRIVHALLDRLDEDKREVFMLAELEQLTAAEISEILEVNPRTVYSRLRAARAEFEAAVSRHLRRGG